MAIQIPNPGTGNGATGDNEFVLWSKVKDNFSDQSNAASKLIGTGANQVPLAPDVFEAYAKKSVTQIVNTDTYTSANQFPVGSKFYVNTAVSTITDMPSSFNLAGDFTVVETLQSLNSRRQVAYGHYDDYLATRTQINGSSTWTAWKAAGQTVKTHRTTTAAGANVVVLPSGELQRSTSITYTNTNTTKDSNGFIKAASPIVKVFADKVELNDDAVNQNVTFKKNGIGDYTITTVSGLSTDGWYIELPKDMNGNPKVAVTLSEVDGVISLKTYKRIFSMETFTFEPDLDNPLDIPDTRWIDLRLNEIPVDIEDDIQTEV